MKISTFAIAFGPQLLMAAVCAAIQPDWYKVLPLWGCVAIGAAVGIFGALVVRVLEPRD
jgi:hypothetical protein